MERLVIISNKYLDFLAVRVGYYLFEFFFFFLFLIFFNLIWQTSFLMWMGNTV
jgi:hypothetical protein